MNSTGITVIIIILVPIAFQVFLLSIKQERRHKEIREILKNIEDRLMKWKRYLTYIQYRFMRI